jgi:hypothetical protein
MASAVAENRPRKSDQVGIAGTGLSGGAVVAGGAENARLDELFFLCSHCVARVEIHVRLNVVDGCIPSDLGDRTSAEIVEQRRLYVAMTRAKNDLHPVVRSASSPIVCMRRGPARLRLADPVIPEQLPGLFDKMAWPIAAPGAAARSAGNPRLDNIAGMYLTCSCGRD